MTGQDDLADDPVKFVLFGILRDLTNGMWQVSGEGSGGVSRAFGEGMWEAVDDLINLKSGNGSKIDRSTPQTAMDGLIEMSKMYELADELSYEVNDDAMVISVKNCKLHPYTDSIEAAGTPRSIGCPFALSSAAMMQEITGELYVIDNIESKDATSTIVLKKL